MLFLSRPKPERNINMRQHNYTTKQNNIQLFRKRHFNHLTYADRLNIERLLNLKNDKTYTGPKITFSYIANIIGVDKATVSREIKRGTFEFHDSTNGMPKSQYLASFGQGVYEKNQKRSHYKQKLDKDSPELIELVELMNSGADPFTALCLYEEKHHEKFPLSEKSIYNYYHRKQLKLKRGTINPRKHKQVIKKTQKMLVKGDNIALRCEEANTRTEFGHWEGDLIIGARGTSKECLFTIIERQTRIYLCFKIENKEMKNIVNVLDTIESIIGKEDFLSMFKSITFDNGTEFRDFNGMAKSIFDNETRTKIYYANPYHSWERGSNENGNRMMRKYFPKGTNFSTISDKAILKATNLINYSYRKLLNNTSSAETLKNLNESFFRNIEMLGLKNPYSNYLLN